MDSEGNDYAEQTDLSEEPGQGASDAEQKIRYKGNAEENAWRKSNDSLEASYSRDPADLSQSQPRRGGRQKATQQSGNYAETYEHQRVEVNRGNFSDGNTVNLDDGNVSEDGGRDPRRDNYDRENDETVFDVNHHNNYHGNCKGGIDAGVDSQRELSSEGEVATEPKYNVSFKSCYDSVNEMWGTKRKKRTNPCSPTGVSFFTKGDRKKRSKRKGTTRKEDKDGCENPLNFRCTFENCCGNCESYIMEIPDSDCSAYQNWENMEFGSANACFDDCCCPRKMKVYSSNLSIASITRPRQSCLTCVESGKCCPSEEQKYEFFVTDCHPSSKPCLQRVHFTRDPSTTTDHSSCSFCSRKCTPSKASLFVEIGESVADVCDLRSRRSRQAFQCADGSTESLGTGSKRKRGSGVRRNKSDSLRSRSKSRKCNPKCKGRPGAVARSYSDKIACMDSCVDDDAIVIGICEEIDPCNPKLRCARSIVSFQEGGECRAQTGSDMYVNKGTADCHQQCETNNRSLWEDIRQGKIWSQLQDTCRNLVKAATTGIGQIIKQSSKLKRSKKCGKCSAYPPNTGECNEWSDPCNPPGCLSEGMCWKEDTSNEPNNIDTHHCQNVCCSFNGNPNVTGLPECQKYDYCGHYRDAREQAPSNRGWRFDPHDGGVEGNVYPPSRGPLEDLQRPKYAEGRKRGGSDRNGASQKRRQPNSSRRSNPNTGEQSSMSSSRGNNSSRKLQRARQPMIQEASNARNQQIRPVATPEQDAEQSTLYIDMFVQTSTIHANVDPGSPPYITGTLAYRRQIKTTKRVGIYPNAIADVPYSERGGLSQSRESSSGPTIEEMDSSLHSLPQKEELKMVTRQGRSSASQRQMPVTSTPTPRAPRQEVSSKTTQPSIRSGSVSRDRSLTKPPEKVTNGKTSTTDKEVQCDIIKKHQIICAEKGATEVTSQADESCVCPSKQGTVPPAEVSDAVQKPPEISALADTTTFGDPPITSTMREDDGATDAAPVEDTPAEESVEKDAAAVEQTVGTDADTSPEQTAETDVNTSAEQTAETGASEATPETQYKTGEAPVDDASAEQTAEESGEPAVQGTVDVPKDTPDAESKTNGVDESDPSQFESAEEKSDAPEKITALTPVADKKTDLGKAAPPYGAPIEYSREFDGGRNYVSVEMQTSSTILTKIVSEFHMGNKKRQILMSIKLQTTSDGADGSDEAAGHQAGPNDVEAGNATEQTPTRDIVPHDNQSQRGRPSITKTPARKPKDLTGNGARVNNGNADGSKYEPCVGPCGRKKPR